MSKAYLMQLLRKVNILYWNKLLLGCTFPHNIKRRCHIQFCMVLHFQQGNKDFGRHDLNKFKIGTYGIVWKLIRQKLRRYINQKKL